MQAVSDDFRRALNVAHRKHSTITVTTPDGMVTPLGWSACTVSSSNSTGVRMSASLTVTPTPGVDLYSIVSTPGALFRIRHGIDYGAGFLEMLDLGVYEAASGGVNVIDGDIDLSLVDQWQRLERCRFSAPFTFDDGFPPSATTRAEMIEAVVTGYAGAEPAIPDGTVVIEDDGGTTDLTGRVWDRDRTQFITDLATDGELDVFFNASGEFVIRKQPILDPSNVVWTFRTGAAGNIISLDRERPFDRLYNRVVVNPIDDEQTWSATYVDIEDETHPRHQSKIGVVPYFYSSPTLTDSDAAYSAAATLLQRVLGTTEELNLGALGAPLEVGDVVSVIHDATPTQPAGLNVTHIVDSWTYDLATGAMSAKTRSIATELPESA